MDVDRMCQDSKESETTKKKVEKEVEEDFQEDKENKGRRNNQRPTYLMFEDFSHEGLGLETYSDGLTHPVELRRILTGDLADEMSVSYKDQEEDTFRSLIYPEMSSARGIKRGVEIFDSTGRSVFTSFSGDPPAVSNSSLMPRPPKLYKAGGVGGQGGHFRHYMGGEEGDSSNEQSLMGQLLAQHSAFSGVSGGGLSGGGPLPAPSPRKPGRPPTAHGAFDPETGCIRYLCRLQCGASLASAKGRRKHEKKHCPNFGKMPQPHLRGGGRRSAASREQEQMMMMAAGGHHSLFGGQSHSVERKTYECRYCGKVLKTYEGRRLHEKLQHVVKMQNIEAANNFEAVMETGEVDTEDSKQLLIEHLKAAGLDPNILEEEEDDGKNGLNESFDNEDDDDDEDDDDIEKDVQSQYDQNDSSTNSDRQDNNFEPVVEYDNAETEDDEN